MNILFSSWFLLAVFSSVAYALVSILQKFAVSDENTDPIAYSIYVELLSGLVALPFALAGISAIPQSLNVWMVVLIVTVLVFGMNIFYFYGLKEIEASQVNIITSSLALWALLGGIIFYKEVVTLRRLIGVLLIVFAIVSIYWQKNSFKSFGIPQLYILIDAMALAAVQLLEKYIVKSMSPMIYLVIAFWGSALLTAVIRPKEVKNLKHLLKFSKGNLFTIISSVLSILSLIAFLYAMRIGGNISAVSPIASSSTVLAVVFSILLLGERKFVVRKILAAVVAFMGILLIG